MYCLQDERVDLKIAGYRPINTCAHRRVYRALLKSFYVTSNITKFIWCTFQSYVIRASNALVCCRIIVVRISFIAYMGPCNVCTDDTHSCMLTKRNYQLTVYRAVILNVTYLILSGVESGAPMWSQNTFASSFGAHSRNSSVSSATSFHLREQPEQVEPEGHSGNRSCKIFALVYLAGCIIVSAVYVVAYGKNQHVYFYSEEVWVPGTVNNVSTRTPLPRLS